MQFWGFPQHTDTILNWDFLSTDTILNWDFFSTDTILNWTEWSANTTQHSSLTSDLSGVLALLPAAVTALATTGWVGDSSFTGGWFSAFTSPPSPSPTSTVTSSADSVISASAETGMKHDMGHFTTAGKPADINMVFHCPVFEASNDLSFGDLESNQQYNYKRIKTTFILCIHFIHSLENYIIDLYSSTFGPVSFLSYIHREAHTHTHTQAHTLKCLQNGAHMFQTERSMKSVPTH